MAFPNRLSAILFVPYLFLTTSAYRILPFEQVSEGNEITKFEQKRIPEHFNAVHGGIRFFFNNVGECPESGDGFKKFYCSSSTRDHKFVCIDDFQLCNGVKDCPNAEDENAKSCLFFRAVRSQISELERSVQTLMRNDARPITRRYSHGITHHGDY